MPPKLDPAVATLARTLDARVVEAAPALHRRGDGGQVRCLACGHRCLILDGLDGICRVRFNRGGRLYAPRGYVAGVAADPIEKKPFFHVLPGARALSFGMLGCDYHCAYCQNWLTSQALRDPRATGALRDISAADLVALARESGAPVVVSTYNEPLISAEWAVEVFAAARDAGLVCGFVSNGNATLEVLDYLRPFVELYKVDLKAFRERAYHQLGGRLAPVLETLAALKERGFWVEVVTLLVPGFNDDAVELHELAAFLAGVSPDIPWHVTAFHRDYRMTQPADTAASDLLRAVEIGKSAGLRHVYAGNLPGQVGDAENTRCSGCAALLIERQGFRVLRDRVGGGGVCPDCGRALAGYWRVPGAA